MRSRLYAVSVLAVLVNGCAGLAPISARDTDTTLSAAIERQLPMLLAAGDYWRASRASYQLAAARSRLNQARAACAALTNSLRYYRRALARDVDNLSSVSDGFDEPGEEDAMTEIRSEFGCVGNRSAGQGHGTPPTPQAREIPVPPVQLG